MEIVTQSILQTVERHGSEFKIQLHHCKYLKEKVPSTVFMIGNNYTASVISVGLPLAMHRNLNLNIFYSWQLWFLHSLEYPDIYLSSHAKDGIV